MLRNNANFADQLEEWQRVRSEKGEDPQDWGEFREHLLRIGAPDPGFLRPDEFSAFADRTGADKMDRALGYAAGEGAMGATQEAKGPPGQDAGA